MRQETTTPTTAGITMLRPEPTVAACAKLHETVLGKWTEVGERCQLHGVTLGDYSYICNDSDMMYASIGNFVSIASHVRINPSNHPWWRPTLHHFTYRPGKYGFQHAGPTDETVFTWRREDGVSIGHDVWIGHGAILLPGVQVGNGAIIGAGSVVTKNVPAWHVVVGNPGRVLRPRFADPAIPEALEQLAWWHWPEETLRVRWHLFCEDAPTFLEKVGQFL